MISIITPVMNGERHIQSCLENVISQCPADIEHIVMDGKSRDQTVTIIERYASKYPHIRWLSERDKGQSNAMNKGIAMARGEVIGLLNVDDYYEPGTLARVNQVFASVPEPGFVVANCNVWDDAGTLRHVNKPSRLNITDLLLGWSINPHPVNPSAYFYHKSLHEIIGPYDEQEHYALDLDFILKAVQVANVRYVNEVWGNYRLLAGTKTVVDQQAGTGADRALQLLSRHRRRLPLWQQYVVRIKEAYYSSRSKAGGIVRSLASH